MITSKPENNVNILWTGGWDSTFQILQLLVVHKLRVTPFYLLDEKRRSTDVELKTMQRIKDLLFKKYPDTQKLLFPTQHFKVSDILSDSAIERAFNTIRQENFLGSQYDWLPRFCKQNSITDIQLCIHRDDKAHLVLENFVTEEMDGPLTVYRVSPKLNTSHEYKIFRYFSFPLFNLRKDQMLAIAAEHGWEEEMGLTWFCHKPTKNMKPCGTCNPCIYTIEEGLAWRIPATSRISYYLHRTFIWPAKSAAKGIRKNLFGRIVRNS